VSRPSRPFAPAFAAALLAGAALQADPAAAAPPAPAPPAAKTAAPPSAAPRKPALPPAAAAPADPKLDVPYGAYQRGFYITAFQEATKQIERDRTDAAAMTLLGELYNQGLGVAQDSRKAAEWYRLAASRGDAHAMASLGLMAADGRGMARNPAEARDWLDKAAAKGEPVACYNLALLLLNGRDGDAARAAGLMRVAADAEIGDAQHGLGVLYSRGLGVERNTAEAARWFLRGARNGSIAGTVEYAIALFNGDGVAKNEPLAARYFRRAAAQGNAIAQNRLARLYATGRGVPRNLVEAAAWHLVAAGQGLADTWLDTTLSDLSKEDRARAEQIAADRVAA
jgi:TPR repeat protein